jgi:hypothetical protein
MVSQRIKDAMFAWAKPILDFVGFEQVVNLGIVEGLQLL